LFFNSIFEGVLTTTRKKLTMQLLTPTNFTDYELLDCGDFEKLERFGKYITIRPEPQAVWPKIYSTADWEKQAHVKFIPRNSSNGDWKKLKQMPEQWEIGYSLKGARDEKQETRNKKQETPVAEALEATRDEKQKTPVAEALEATRDEKQKTPVAEALEATRNENQDLVFRLGLTAFKHVGVFPEQAVNWDKIYNFLRTKEKAKFLNLFAYTGGASLAAKAAGADVTHVDSIKQVVTWANENMQKSKLDNIRWLVDDALKFVKKEQRRGNLYQGIILDPPAFGHGPAGEKWKLEDNIAEMMDTVLQLLDPNEHLLILNAYSLGFSALVPENLLKPFAVKNKSELSIGELYLEAKSGVKLPLGVWGNLLK
jgi:23S rRNA (cytosine1962-C5)-methyltransferase